MLYATSQMREMQLQACCTSNASARKPESAKADKCASSKPLQPPMPGSSHSKKYFKMYCPAKRSPKWRERNELGGFMPRLSQLTLWTSHACASHMPITESRPSAKKRSSGSPLPGLPENTGTPTVLLVLSARGDQDTNSVPRLFSAAAASWRLSSIILCISRG